MSVNTSEQADAVTIHIQGRFDFATHQDFLHAYKAYPRGERRFAVDLSGAEYMDSSAMGMLLQLRDYAAPGSMVDLRNGNEGIKEILRIANFDKLFKLA